MGCALSKKSTIPIADVTTSPPMDSDLTEKQLKDYRETFKFFDKDNDGTVSKDELGEVMRSLGVRATDSELRDMIHEIDTDGSGLIEFDEFLKMMSHTSTDGNAEAELQSAFTLFDQDGDGFITKEELIKAMTLMGENITSDEAESMIRDGDQDYDGKINFREFKRMMSVR